MLVPCYEHAATHTRTLRHTPTHSLTQTHTHTEVKACAVEQEPTVAGQWNTKIMS